MSSTRSSTRTATLGRARAVALYLSAILGAGLLVMPSLAYRAAGPASVLAWLALLLISAPSALTFAHLSAMRPDASGVGAFVSAAYGRRVGYAASWWFVLAVPLGAPATAMVGAAYAQRALGLDPAARPYVTGVLLVTAIACALTGVTVTGAIHVGLMTIFATVLGIGIVGALPQADPTNLQPFAPHGPSGIVSAAGILFFSFAGWEAVAPLTRFFARPHRDARMVACWVLGIVSVLYLALSMTTMLVIGTGLNQTDTPVERLLATTLGEMAAPVTGAVAVTLTVGAIVSYVTGAGHMTAGLARDRQLPASWAAGAIDRETPLRAIAAVAIAAGVVQVATWLLAIPLPTLMTLASAMFIAVTAAGLAAGSVLLSRRAARVTATLSALVLTGLLLACGWAALYPLGVLVAATALTRRAGRATRSPGSGRPPWVTRARRAGRRAPNDSIPPND